MSKKYSEKSEMSEACLSEAQWLRDRLRNDVAPRSLGSGKYRQSVVANKLRWKPSRVADAWHGDERRTVHIYELRQVEQITGKQYGAPELREVDELTTRALALLDGADAYPNGALVAAMRAFVGTLAGTRTGDDADR